MKRILLSLIAIALSSSALMAQQTQKTISKTWTLAEDNFNYEKPLPWTISPEPGIEWVIAKSGTGKMSFDSSYGLCFNKPVNSFSFTSESFADNKITEIKVQSASKDGGLMTAAIGETRLKFIINNSEEPDAQVPPATINGYPEFTIRPQAAIGHLSGKISINWTVLSTSYVKSITVTYLDDGVTTGVDAIDTDTNAPKEYYNLQGVSVANPEKGLYIVRQGNKVSKVQL